MEKRQRNHNIRFNMENEEARKAWENLHSKEVEKDFKSLNAFVITAINDYYERHLQIKADSYFETREKEDAFAERMVQMVEQKGTCESPGTCRNVPDATEYADGRIDRNWTGSGQYLPTTDECSFYSTCQSRATIHKK